MANRLFELYAAGSHTLFYTLRKFLKIEYGKVMSLGNIHLILKKKFYGAPRESPNNFHQSRTFPWDIADAITDQCAYTITRPGPRTSNGSSTLTRPSVGRS
jgi:hypothetical protein